MLRVKRIKKSELSPQSAELCRHLNAWIDELTAKATPDCVALLPHVEQNGDCFNFMTVREGGCKELAGDRLDVKQRTELSKRKDLLLEYLKSSIPLLNSALEGQRGYLATLVERSAHLMVFEQGVPLLLPFETKLEAETALKAKVIPPVVTKGHGCLLPLLLLGLLVLLALVAWWYLRPWPFVDSESQAREIQQAATEETKTDPSHVASPQKEEAVTEDEETKLKAQSEDEQRRLAEKQRLDEEKKKAEALKLKEEQDRLKKEEAQRQALKEQQAKAASKPKCKVMRQEGTLPKMVIAFDGSQSMLLDDVPGSTSRLAAAKDAARRLADSVDKNVEIGLVEVNGCPAAKSRGFFTGIQRSALKSTIAGVNPMRYDGKTPLVDGLQQISKMTDGVKADAVGILISDGEDTCPMTANLDVCQVARAIHKRQPRLKIHTILIGEDASQAACVAKITGGKVFSPQNAHEIDAGLQSSGAEMKKICDE